MLSCALFVLFKEVLKKIKIFFRVHVVGLYIIWSVDGFFDAVNLVKIIVQVYTLYGFNPLNLRNQVNLTGDEAIWK